MRTATLHRIGKSSRTDDSARTDSKNKILFLLANLEVEFISFVSAESELFKSISGIKERTFGDEGSKEKNVESQVPALRDLKWSIKRVETSHQRLMALLSEICAVLSNMGL